MEAALSSEKIWIRCEKDSRINEITMALSEKGVEAVR